jgi:hypothetical protein
MWLAVLLPVVWWLVVVHVIDTVRLGRYRIWSKNRPGSFDSWQVVRHSGKGCRSILGHLRRFCGSSPSYCKNPGGMVKGYCIFAPEGKDLEKPKIEPS